MLTLDSLPHLTTLMWGKTRTGRIHGYNSALTSVNDHNSFCPLMNGYWNLINQSSNQMELILQLWSIMSILHLIKVPLMYPKVLSCCWPQFRYIVHKHFRFLGFWFSHLFCLHFWNSRMDVSAFWGLFIYNNVGDYSFHMILNTEYS